MVVEDQSVLGFGSVLVVARNELYYLVWKLEPFIYLQECCLLFGCGWKLGEAFVRHQLGKGPLLLIGPLNGSMHVIGPKSFRVPRIFSVDS